VLLDNGWARVTLFACLRADYGRSLVVSYCIKMLRRAFCSHVPVEDHHGMFRSTWYSHISELKGHSSMGLPQDFYIYYRDWLISWIMWPLHRK